jgi:hypothetical protein
VQLADTIKSADLSTVHRISNRNHESGIVMNDVAITERIKMILDKCLWRYECEWSKLGQSFMSSFCERGDES